MAIVNSWNAEHLTNFSRHLATAYGAGVDYPLSLPVSHHWSSATLTHFGNYLTRGYGMGR